MPVHQQKGLSLVNGIVRQRQRQRPFINVDTRFINDPLRGFLSILQVFEYRLSKGQNDYSIVREKASWWYIAWNEKLFVCYDEGNVILKFCKEMETICFLSNISWNILIFFLSTRRYFWTDDPFCYFFLS